MAAARRREVGCTAERIVAAGALTAGAICGNSFHPCLAFRLRHESTP
jgi:hypothetical protein